MTINFCQAPGYKDVKNEPWSCSQGALSLVVGKGFYKMVKLLNME